MKKEALKLSLMELKDFAGCLLNRASNLEFPISTFFIVFRFLDI